ncbi:MAG TPA: hypothetical protein V6C84_10990 [Coleofasciculaceae cyanobacterium]|jgi:hypothetical protein
MQYFYLIWIFSKLIFVILRFVSKTLRASVPGYSRWIDKAVPQQLGKITLIFVLILTFPPLYLFSIFISIRNYFIYFHKRQEARNPETATEQLRKLAGVRDRVTQLGVVCNPNTPSEVLLKLGEKFPKELLENFVFSLMLLEDVNLFETMPRATFKSILSMKDVPVGFLERSVAIPNLEVTIARVIAKHPKATEYTFEQIAQYSWDTQIIQLLIKRSSLSDTILKKIAAHGAGGMKLYLTERSKFPQDALEKIVQNTLAMHLVQPSNDFITLLEVLAQEGTPQIQLYLAQQPHLPVTVLEKLEREGSTKVRACLAQQPDLPLHMLKRLSYSSHSSIRELIVQHPHVSLELLQDLARDDNAQVRKLALRQLARQQNINHF